MREFDIASRIRADIVDCDRRMAEDLAALRDQGCSDVLLDQMRERWQARHRFDGLQMGLYGLLGFHSVDGRIPVDAVWALLDAVRASEQEGRGEGDW